MFSFLSKSSYKSFTKVQHTIILILSLLGLKDLLDFKLLWNAEKNSYSKTDHTEWVKRCELGSMWTLSCKSEIRWINHAHYSVILCCMLKQIPAGKSIIFKPRSQTKGILQDVFLINLFDFGTFIGKRPCCVLPGADSQLKY